MEQKGLSEKLLETIGLEAAKLIQKGTLITPTISIDEPLSISDQNIVKIYDFAASTIFHCAAYTNIEDISNFLNKEIKVFESYIDNYYKNSTLAQKIFDIAESVIQSYKGEQLNKPTEEENAAYKARYIATVKHCIKAFKHLSEKIQFIASMELSDDNFSTP